MPSFGSVMKAIGRNALRVGVGFAAGGPAGAVAAIPGAIAQEIRPAVQRAEDHAWGALVIAAARACLLAQVEIPGQGKGTERAPLADAFIKGAMMALNIAPDNADTLVPQLRELGLQVAKGSKWIDAPGSLDATL